jgi:hypothetical protein
MHTILLYPNGRRADGIILSASYDTMRVVFKRSADTVDLRRVGGVWTSEDGLPVEFELLSIAGNTRFHGNCNFEIKPLTFTAGSQAAYPFESRFLPM